MPTAEGAMTGLGTCISAGFEFGEHNYWPHKISQRLERGGSVRLGTGERESDAINQQIRHKMTASPLRIDIGTWLESLPGRMIKHQSQAPACVTLDLALPKSDDSKAAGLKFPVYRPIS
jgi:hypothetical protein